MSNNVLLSIIIPTKNCATQLDNCLRAIKDQTYKRIEIIISDGMSSDNTLSIAKKYSVKTFVNKKILAEPGVSLGFKNAKGEVLMVLAVDNIFKEKDSIEKMMEIFTNKDIFAAYPKHDSTKSDTLFTKYINVFTDPFNHFVYGYAANTRTFKKIYKTLIHNRTYDIYDFSSSSVRPILAVAQGFSVRREFLKERKNEMDDIKPVLELIKENKRMAYVHSVSLYHHTIESMKQFIRKTRWSTRNALTGKRYGIALRMNTLSNWQRAKIYIFPFYSLSIIFPILYALYHFLKDREKMWLFHPFIVFISAIAMIYEYARMMLGLEANAVK